ncbi:hypothetical protein D4U92_28880 [Escherichia coli]|nr:hypothetical protein [Escherichia coli]
MRNIRNCGQNSMKPGKTFRPKILSMQTNYWLPLAENLLKGLATRMIRNGLRGSRPAILCTRTSKKRNRTTRKRNKTAQMRYKTSQKRNSLNQWRNRKWKKSAPPAVRPAAATALIVAR